MSATPKPPAGLQSAGRGLWRKVIADLESGWQLDARDVHLLEQACHALDRAGELEDLVAADGLMVRGSKGQERLHPAVSEARLQRQLSAALVSKVELGPPDVRTGSLSGRQRADLRRLVGGGRG